MAVNAIDIKGFRAACQPSNTRILNLVFLVAAPGFCMFDAAASRLITCDTRHIETRFANISASAQRSKRRKRPLRKPDVIYYSTPPETVAELLRVAGIKPGDVLYDLGSGDGRIPIAAAQHYGIRAVGIEIDPKLVTEAEENARRADVSSLVRFLNEDMFRANLSEATIVTLYLSEKLNLLLRPKLLRELRPGSRIVSHDFRMGDWKPEQTVRVPWGKLYRTVYLWTVPAPRHTGKQRAGMFLKLHQRNSFAFGQTTSNQK